jgi:hypothetical protein
MTTGWALVGVLWTSYMLATPSAIRVRIASFMLFPSIILMTTTERHDGVDSYSLLGDCSKTPCYSQRAAA